MSLSLRFVTESGEDLAGANVAEYLAVVACHPLHYAKRLYVVPEHGLSAVRACVL